MRVTVIGAGPGGYETALYAAKRGFEVTLIEKAELGGTCLNRGCIPTKALLAVSDNLNAIREAEKFGIAVPEGTRPDFAAAFARKDQVVASLTSGIGYLMGANKVRVVSGTGVIRDAHHVEVSLNEGGTEIVETDKLIIATGSSPVTPPMFGYDGVQVITSDELLSLTEQPESLIIIGGGVIGCEIAQFMARMGTKVTVLEMMPHILPLEDRETVKPLEKAFRKDKIKVSCGKGVEKVEKKPEEVEVTLADGTIHTAKLVLLCIGRRPVTRGIGLENVNVEMTERGFIKIDEYCQTSVADIYAIGDVVPTTQLAHVAAYEGFVAVDHIAGEARQADYRAVPRCIYTDPEVAGVGLTEAEAEAKGIALKSGRFDLIALGKAKASGHTDGFVKLLVDENDVIVGGTVVGARATDMLGAVTMAVQYRITAKQLGETIFPHPTMSEAIMEAAHDVHGKSVHKG
ncbi:MAG: dihydrolipoyl dehydrogenase [Clostridia bacterium]|nr:dihydrolipoyl dehydrogenase [Clostridia bacterium]